MLNFIKKHYEKMILTALLIVFVVLLVLQLSILLEGRNVAKEDFKLTLRADYKRVNFKNQKYETLASLPESLKWANGAPRTPGDKLFTDLSSPLELARCPYCEHLVPIGDFKARKCSFCAAVLKPVPPRPTDREDDDKDGIPNADEIKLGLNPKDPKDAEEDLDNDGFSNIEEYLIGTDMRDPKSHPSYSTKLSVVDVVRKKLNMKISNIMAKGAERSKWMVQIAILDNGKDRTRFVYINNVVKGDDGEFKLVDILPEFRTELDPKLGAEVERNRSKAVLQKTGSDERLVGEIGKDIVESKEKIVLLYGITNKKIELYVGDTITLGDERTGVEKFVVSSCDPAKSTVTLKRDDGKLFELLPKKIVDQPAASGRGVDRPPVGVPF